MNKTTTTADVERIFLGAKSEEKDGVITLPLHLKMPALRLVMPPELPLGLDATPLLPGNFHVADLSEFCRALGTEFPVWIATGRFEPSDGESAGSGTGDEAKFYFEDPLGARQLLVAVRWENNPAHQTKDGLGSWFAEEYQARFFQRFWPLEVPDLNQVLLNVSGLTTPRTVWSGLDFWVIERTDFYCQTCEMLSQNLQQVIMMGNREQESDTTTTVCRQLFKDLAQEIEQDTRLAGWRLVCKDVDATLTMVDSQGAVQTVTLFYKPVFLTGARDYVKRAQEGTLVLPTGG